MKAIPGIDIARCLMVACPLLEKHYPPGWVDFRSALPTDWRSGLYVRIPSEISMEPCENPATLKFKAFFGGVVLAVESASQVSETIHQNVTVIPPHVAEVGCEGEWTKIRVPYWAIQFELPKEFRFGAPGLEAGAPSLQMCEPTD